MFLQPSSTTVTIPNPLPVSGTVSVGNFPATQPVSGSVSVSNFPASQPVTDAAAEASLASLVAALTNPLPVSAASLPLPAGAATDATLAAVRDAANEVALTAILQREQVELTT